MIITTKFDVGDRVFVMNGNQVTEGSVIKIEISHYTGEKKRNVLLPSRNLLNHYRIDI